MPVLTLQVDKVKYKSKENNTCTMLFILFVLSTIVFQSNYTLPLFSEGIPAPIRLGSEEDMEPKVSHLHPAGTGSKLPGE